MVLDRPVRAAGRTRQRNGHHPDPAPGRAARSAAASPAPRVPRRSAARRADDGDCPGPVDHGPGHRRSAGAAGSGGVREHGSVHPLRHPQRLRGCARARDAGGCRAPRGRPIGNRSAQRPPWLVGREPVLSLSPGAAMERTRSDLDGLGAQAREDRGVQPAPERVEGHELRGTDRHPAGPSGGALLPHARFGHASAA